MSNRKQKEFLKALKEKFSEDPRKPQPPTPDPHPTTNPDLKRTCPLCGKPMVKHILAEGHRHHVHRYDYSGVHCSEENCEVNHGEGKCDNGNL